MGSASKAKGSSFERAVCTQLSLWITNGVRKDTFWRSAMSGGRATVARKRGKDVRQAGDITSVGREGHDLTDRVFIECKHYASLQVESFILENKGTLAKFWKVACEEAAQRGKVPWLIARQNRRDTMLLMPTGWVGAAYIKPAEPLCTVRGCDIWRFDEVMRCPPVDGKPWIEPRSIARTRERIT